MAHKKEFSFVDIGTISTREELVSLILEKVKKLGDFINLLVFKHHEVQIGVIRDGKIELERQEELVPELLKELRAFSQKGELYIWRQGENFKYRLRLDGEGDKKIWSYTEKHLMWGTKVQGNVVIEENRGMKYTMPFPTSNLKLPLRYEVKNYYAFDKMGLIQFQDARLVQFFNGDGKQLAQCLGGNQNV